MGYGTATFGLRDPALWVFAEQTKLLSPALPRAGARGVCPGDRYHRQGRASGRLLIGIRAYHACRPLPILTLDPTGRLCPVDHDDPSTRFRDGLDRKRGPVHAPQSRRRGPAGMQLDADEYGRLHGFARRWNGGSPPTRDLSAHASPPVRRRAKPAGDALRAFSFSAWSTCGDEHRRRYPSPGPGP